MTHLTDCLDPESPVHVVGADRHGDWIVTCDHATNRVPPEIGDLRLPAADMNRHIAYDIGALGVARALGELLNAPVVSSNFSRLVIDPNRGTDDPTLVMQLYDGSIIPANRAVAEEDRAERITSYYQPYDDALASAMADHPGAALVSIHSFTPQLRGRPARPWQVGVLFADDARLSQPFIGTLQSDPDLCVGVNEPYVGHLPGDAVDRHALKAGRHNTLIELRNDLIESPDGQAQWAKYLAPRLITALAAVS